MSAETGESTSSAPSDFVREIVAQDVADKKFSQIVTRFPPEPNGYLHIGHAKSICLNFGIAREHGGKCNLRMDDTNPAKEDVAYVEAITADVRWLIKGWADHCLALKPRGASPDADTRTGVPDYYMAGVSAEAAEAEPFFASDYFDQLHDYACALIRAGRAYVCDLSPKETDEYRGAPDRPGRDSPWRNRPVAENLDLFARMKAGEFPDGARSLRAKIDMASPNVWLRDPLLYRIRHASHHHTGNKWCIYPLYDFAHCLSDYLEGVTHSICTLEFVDHRALYDWILDSLELPRARPHQYEFAKLIPNYVIVSKRKLLTLVQENVVSGWDDPRMPTLSGLRRRGVPASAIRNFVIGLGVTKFDAITDIALFEHALREELNRLASRRLAVLRPLKLVLTNLGPDEVWECQATNNPQDESPTTRTVALTREVYIEQDDFAETPPPKYFRLKPGGEVRLKYGCIVKFERTVKDAQGTLLEVHVTADPETRAGGAQVDRKVKGTIHWVSAPHALDAEVRVYDRLFSTENAEAGGDFRVNINPNSLTVVTAKLEPSLATAESASEYFQFERLGYFVLDAKEARPGQPIFNRTISLRDSWAKA